MNYYPFRKFKLNKKHLFPVLNKKDMYPQHKTDIEKEIFNQVFYGVKVNFISAYNLIIPSRSDKVNYVELTLETGEVIRIKNELFSEHISNISIKKGLIEEGLIFIAAGLELNVVFEGEELFSFYHTELLSQCSSDIFKIKEKDLPIGSVCSMNISEETESTFVYIGKYYYRRFYKSRVAINNARTEHRDCIRILNYLPEIFVFKYMKNGLSYYLLKKDLSKVHKHSFIPIENIEEKQEINLSFEILTKIKEDYNLESFLNLLRNNKLSPVYFSNCDEITLVETSKELFSSTISRNFND